MTRQRPDTATFLGGHYFVASWGGGPTSYDIVPLATRMESTANYRGRADHIEIANGSIYLRSIVATLREPPPPIAGMTHDGRHLYFADLVVPLTGRLAIGRELDHMWIVHDVIFDVRDGLVVRARFREPPPPAAATALPGAELVHDRAYELYGHEVRSSTSTLRLHASELVGSTLEPMPEDLWELDLSNTRVETIAVLRATTRLARLDLSRTHVRDLSPLRDLPLERLDLTGAGAVTDLSPLAGMTTLRELLLDGTSVVDLSPIAHLEAGLDELVLPPALLERDVLAGTRSTTVVDVRGRAISDLSPYAWLENVETLDVADTQVSDLSVLRCNSLGSVDVSRTAVRTLAPLADAPLHRLGIADTAIDDLTVLRRAVLTELDATRSRVGALPARWTSLVTLRIGGTRITPDASLARFGGLHTLELGHLSCDSIDWIAGIRSLRVLDVSHTGVTTLAPLRKISLESLDVTWSLLPSLAELQPLQWTLRTLALDVDKLPLLGAVKDLLVTRLVLSGRGRPGELEAVLPVLAKAPMKYVEVLELVDLPASPPSLQALARLWPRASVVQN